MIGEPSHSVATSRRGLPRALPWIVAGVIWLALALLTANRDWRFAAQSHVGWMIEPLYHDMVVVRLGWQTVLAGTDPLSDLANPFNYPRFVLLPAYAGAVHVPVGVIGLGLAAAFLGAVVRVVGTNSRVVATIAVIALISPPVLLVIERGNLDAGAFILLAIGLRLLAADVHLPLYRAAGVAALVVAALLKLFPVVALVAGALYWRDARRRWFLAGLLVFFGWALVFSGDIAWVIRKTTRGLSLSYGEAIAASRYYHDRVAVEFSSTAAQSWLSQALRISAAVYLGGVVIAAAVGFRCRNRFQELRTQPWASLAFATGALIYAGTFALGANWSYRLVFLLFCVPLLVEGVRRPGLRCWSWGCATGIALTMLSPFTLGLAPFLAQQTVNWLTAWALLGGAAAVLASPQLTPSETLERGRSAS